MHRWLYILSDSLIVPAPLNMHCTYLGVQTNSSQAAGCYKNHLFSKSWTTGVLGVQFAENRGGVDWVVLLWLARDHLSIEARMKTCLLDEDCKNICKANYKEDCKRKMRMD